MPEKEDSLDPVLDNILKTLPQLPQVQYETSLQLEYLWRFAVRYGLYDASECLRKNYLSR
jgi:hypothetical protein